MRLSCLSSGPQAVKINSLWSFHAWWNVPLVLGGRPYPGCDAVSVFIILENRACMNTPPWVFRVRWPLSVFYELETGVSGRVNKP